MKEWMLRLRRVLNVTSCPADELSEYGPGVQDLTIHTLGDRLRFEELPAELMESIQNATWLDQKLYDAIVVSHIY